jgi:aminoglycoside phosphotransferase (APT) family kinase protein
MEQRLDMQRPVVSFPGLAEALPNPALWAYDVGRRAPGDSPTTAITHGDLHADNFFIDRNRQAWLIDFGQTGYSHALRDFVELEAVLKLRLTDFGADGLAGLAALEEALLAANRVDSLLLLPAPPSPARSLS